MSLSLSLCVCLFVCVWVFYQSKYMRSFDESLFSRVMMNNSLY